MEEYLDNWVDGNSYRGAAYAWTQPTHGMGSISDFPRYSFDDDKIRRCFLTEYWLENPQLLRYRQPNGAIRCVSEYQRFILNQLGTDNLTTTVFNSFTAYNKVKHGFDRSS